jgi:hypothetical protein
VTPADFYAWPAPGPADTARALEGISADIDPGQPIPFTLTAKAPAALDQDGAR